jgi:putative peptidoglycan lipid II flippase
MLLTLLGALAIFLVVLGPHVLHLLAPTFSNTKLALSESLLVELLPALILASLASVWAAVLNAEGSFAAPALAAMATPVVALSSVLVGGNSIGIRALALGTVLGTLSETCILACVLWRKYSISVLPQWRGVTAPFWRVITQFVPMVGGSVLMSVNLVVDQTMATPFGSGSVAALGYGGKLVGLLLGLSVTALGTVALPHFSHMLARQPWESVRRSLRVYAIVTFGVSSIVCLLGIAASRLIVGVVFRRGSFTEADARLVSTIQSYYLLQFPFHLTGMLFVRLITAAGRNHILLMIGLLSVAVNLVGNIVLSRHFGVAGIALSTSFAYLVSSALAATFVWYLLPGSSSRISDDPETMQPTALPLSFSIRDE